ncbi:MAG: ABC transporter permease [Verrucomicrobiae bacterium]|nr:ABC transporter permease [Verrucomicrobiae bacterium]
MNELRFAFRQLLKSPGFTAAAVLTLALGIGANTAIFSVANAVLLRPLPYRDSGQLVWVYRQNATLGYNRIVVTPGRFWNLQERNTCFSQMALLQPTDFTLVGDENPRQLRGLCVSPNLTQVLGVKPVLGRGFQSEEGEDGNHRVVLLSFALWQSRFGGDPNVIGRSIRSDTDTFTVVGVLPQDLHFPLGTLAGAATTLKQPAEIWTPAVWTPDQKAGKDGDGAGHVLARLKPDATVEQADAEVRIINEQYDGEQRRTDWTVRAELLEEQIAGHARPLIFLLLAAAGLVLLIACVNVANLFLMRGSARHKEMAIRAALGASRFQILRQLWSESLLFSLIGGGCGMLLAFWGVRALILLLPADLPRLGETQIDPAVLCFAGALSILAGLLFGSAPALQATRVGLNEAFKENSRGLTTTLRSHRLRNGLVVSEIALSLMLLAGAGLMVRSFAQLNRVQPGFDPENVLAVGLVFSPARYPGPAAREARQAFTSQLIERLEALPGVRSAAACMGVPLAGGRIFSNLPLLLEGQPVPAPGSEQFVRWRGVSPGYFSTTGIPLLKGRDFNDQDKPMVAAIVSEGFVRKYFDGREPIGLKCNLGEIIGVVGDCLDLSLDLPAEPRIYLPVYDFSTQAILVRSTGDPRALASAVEATVLALDKFQPVQSVQPLEQVLSESISQRRSQMVLLGLLASAALALAAVGIYGVMASLVIERTHEIGIRMALGARASDVFRLVVRNGMSLAMIGGVAGLIGTLALTPVLRSFLFGVNPMDPLTLIAGALLLTLVALLACWLPARRAAIVDPMVALRRE